MSELLVKLLPKQVQAALLGAALLGSATAWLDHRIQAAVEPIATQVAQLDRDVRAQDAALAAKNDAQDAQIAFLKGRLAAPAQAAFVGGK
ncbi:MAG TPA: hypothetical protein VMB50_20905 [Myxococcales bacterium]|nr:hypothetical protein [Myxococcales bacterium]